MLLNKLLIAGGLGISILAVPQTLLAHAFGQTYTLPVPLWLYLWGAAAAVVVSFLVFGLLIGKKSVSDEPPRVLLKVKPSWIGAARALSLALLVFTIFAGYVGSQEPYLNFNVPFFWVIFLLGFTYLIAIFGNFWAYINPMQTIVSCIERLTKTEFNGIEKYPKKIGYLPALITFFLVIWLELFSGGIGIVPRNLSFILFTYVNLNILLAYWYGKDSWFRYGEFFSVFFRLVGKVSPLEYSRGVIGIRKPFSGLLKSKADRFSLTVFILFMLSSTGFDGFRETEVWGQVISSLPRWLDPQIFNTVVLIISPIALLFIYLLFIWMTKVITGSNKTVADLALAFSFSLIPIAVFYNVAHYFPMLIIQGQSLISLFSDPFGLGWNLFGTAEYELNLRLIDAATVWYSQITLIIIGHIAAVYVAHIESLRQFSRNSLRSQLPILALMVIYTVGSLWIIAQPIVVEAADAASKNAEFNKNIETLRQPPPPERPIEVAP